MDENGKKSIKQHWAEMISQKSPEWKKATLQTYQKTWNVVFSHFFDIEKDPSTINQASILQLKSWYLKEHPTREPSKVRIHLKVFVDYLEAIGAISSPPDISCLRDLTKIVQRNSRREKPGRALSRAESDRLMEAAAFYENLTAGAAVLLSLSAGMRKREILDSDKLGFEIEKNLLKVWSQKNSKFREIPLNLITSGPFGSKILYFLKNSNILQVMSSEAFQWHWVKIKASAGISGRLRFHDLRHTFATRTAEANWPPITACDILDMSLQVYQKIYAKPSLESKIELFKRL